MTIAAVAPTATAVPARTREYGLDVLRILAIAGVVAIHVFGGSVRHEPRRSATWWIAVAIDLGSSWTVPVFVMISGALLLHPKVHAAGPAAFYRKRLARILPAMAAWYLIYLVVVQGWLPSSRRRAYRGCWATSGRSRSAA